MRDVFSQLDSLLLSIEHHWSQCYFYALHHIHICAAPNAPHTMHCASHSFTAVSPAAHCVKHTNAQRAVPEKLWSLHIWAWPIQTQANAKWAEQGHKMYLLLFLLLVVEGHHCLLGLSIHRLQQTAWPMSDVHSRDCKSLSFVHNDELKNKLVMFSALYNNSASCAARQHALCHNRWCGSTLTLISIM